MTNFFRSRRRKTAAIIFGLLFVLLVMPIFEKFYFTCAACGMSRTEFRVLGSEFFGTNRETEFSKWYDTNVEPHHNHVWVRGTWSESVAVCAISWGDTHIWARASGPLIHFFASETHDPISSIRFDR